MGILQKAYETYENHHRYVGVQDSTTKEPLAPIGHIITSAQLEITIDDRGRFVAAALVDKNEPKIMIPATEKSSGRSGTTIAPHPLCDYLEYISDLNRDKMDAYIEQLTEWAESEHSHPMLMPILTYVKNGTIRSDLERSGITKADEKNTVRWIVLGLSSDGGSCWTNKNLFDSFVRYYTAKKEQGEQILCMVTGETTAAATQHLRGIVSVNNKAKLISANDKTNFTYRGRFKTDDEALTIGYAASQKAHNALKWLIASQSVLIDGRAFLCWNPQGKRITSAAGIIRGRFAEPKISLDQYREDLQKELLGFQAEFSPADCAVLAVFDAATSGRLALTYYNELRVQDFLKHLEHWDLTCAWKSRFEGVSAPNLYQIVDCAFGTARDGKLETDDRVKKQQIQRLFLCRTEGGKMPFDIVQAIAQRTMQPLAYDKYTREDLQFTACAVIRKYYMDFRQEEYRMALEKDKKDISYQYGRLLAVLEKAERDTYDRDEGRDPNAIRLQSVFCTRPAQTSRIIIEQVKKGYYPKLKPGMRVYYEQLIGEIFEMIASFPDAEQNAPLKETYIMGYYLQKNALYTKNTESETEE